MDFVSAFLDGWRWARQRSLAADAEEKWVTAKNGSHIKLDEEGRVTAGRGYKRLLSTVQKIPATADRQSAVEAIKELEKRSGFKVDVRNEHVIKVNGNQYHLLRSDKGWTLKDAGPISQPQNQPRPDPKRYWRQREGRTFRLQ